MAYTRPLMYYIPPFEIRIVNTNRCVDGDCPFDADSISLNIQ